MDGIDHPNIIRACYIHSRYLDPTLINPGNLNTNYIFEHDILLSLWLIVIQARNERIFVDAARFLTNVFVGTQAVSVSAHHFASLLLPINNRSHRLWERLVKLPGAVFKKCLLLLLPPVLFLVKPWLLL